MAFPPTGGRRLPTRSSRDPGRPCSTRPRTGSTCRWPSWRNSSRIDRLEEEDVEKVKKVVLAYSGGLDTSVILRWLIETYGCEVIAFVADLGQGGELAPGRAKAKKTGASQGYGDNGQDEFAREFIYHAP